MTTGQWDNEGNGTFNAGTAQWIQRIPDVKVLSALEWDNECNGNQI